MAEEEAGEGGRGEADRCPLDVAGPAPEARGGVEVRGAEGEREGAPVVGGGGNGE